MRPAASRPTAAAAGLAAALIGALAGLRLGGPVQIASSAVLAGAMGAIAAEDLRRFRVPDALNLIAAAAGLASVLAEASAAGADLPSAALRAAIGALACGGALYILREAFFRLRGIDGLGFGDVKLGAVGGLWLGWELFAVAILLAAIGALIFVGVSTATHGPWPRDRRLPLALYLAPAIWLSWYVSRLVVI